MINQAEWDRHEREALIRLGVPLPLKASKKARKSLTAKVNELYIKGPYPVSWQTKAAAISPSALVVGNALWLMASITGSKTVSISRDILALYHISRWTYYRCIEEMETQGLISVARKEGKRLYITILYSS